MSQIERDGRDEAAERVAEALWPARYMGDLSRAEWERCYAVVDAANDQLRGAVEALTELIDAAETFIHDGTTSREYLRFVAAMNDARPYSNRGQ